MAFLGHPSNDGVSKKKIIGVYILLHQPASHLETNLDDFIDSDNFSVRGYLLLIRKDFVTNTHALGVYDKEGLPFARDLSLENSVDSYFCFPRLYFIQCLTSFFSIDHLLRLYARFLMFFYLT